MTPLRAKYIRDLVIRDRHLHLSRLPTRLTERKELTLSAFKVIRRVSSHILPPSLVRIRHYGILGNNRRRRDIEVAPVIFKRRGCAIELQPQSVVDPPCGGTCCPLCGKVGIRLVAFTDATGVLHMIGVGPMPCDSS